MNATLVRSVLCELSYAVTTAIKNDRELAAKRKNLRAYSDFLADWGVEVATDLTVSENSTVNPSGMWTPVSPITAVFTLGGSISGGAVATNEGKYNVFFTVAQLYKPKYFPANSEIRPCRDPSGNKEGSPLVDIDLQLLPTLESRIQVVELGFAPAPIKAETITSEKNVLSQTVSIKESVSGDITPTWKFVSGAADTSGKLFSTGRERTHQIVFTFGQLAPSGLALVPLAESFHQFEQLKAGLRGTQLSQ